MVKIYLSFDVEEFFFPEIKNLNIDLKNSTKPSLEGCKQLIALLGKNGIKATFFITEFFAKKEPAIIKVLYNNGHEVACHSFKHISLKEFKKEEYAPQIKRSKHFLEKLIRCKVNGFRSPGLFINNGLMDILEDAGFDYDSSLHPTFIPNHYNFFFCKKRPYNPNEADFRKKGKRKILEIPISVTPLINFPVSWWWMRNIGGWLTDYSTRFNLILKRPVVLYFHPWEFVKLPQINGIPSSLTSNCGQNFLNTLEIFIENNIRRGVKFGRLDELTRAPI